MPAPQDAERQRQAEQFTRIFERQRSDGSYYYSDEDVREFIPLLVFAAGDTMPDPWPEHVTEVMQEFSARIGVKPGASVEQVQSAMDAYYKQYPLNAELLQAFQDVVKLEQQGGGTGARAARAQNFLGNRTSVRPIGEAPPAGAVKAAAWRLGAAGKVDVPSSKAPPKEAAPKKSTTSKKKR